MFTSSLLKSRRLDNYRKERRTAAILCSVMIIMTILLIIFHPFPLSVPLSTRTAEPPVAPDPTTFELFELSLELKRSMLVSFIQATNLNEAQELVFQDVDKILGVSQ